MYTDDMKYLKNTSGVLTVFSVVFFSLCYFWPADSGLPEIIQISAGIFGIYVGFAVANSRSRLNQIDNMLKVENANNLLIYKLSQSFGKEEQAKIRGMLDDYIIDQIDYRLEDFRLSRKSFFKLYDHVVQLKPKDENQEATLAAMIECLNTSSTNRSNIESVVAQRISRHEWVAIIILGAVLVANLYSASDGSWQTALILTGIGAASVLLMLVLSELNDLKWQKDIWTWKPFHQLFLDLDLVPYYSRRLLEIGEAKVEKGEKVRLADYPNPYPDTTGKVVTTEEYGVRVLG